MPRDPWNGESIEQIISGDSNGRLYQIRRNHCADDQQSFSQLSLISSFLLLDCDLLLLLFEPELIALKAAIENGFAFLESVIESVEDSRLGNYRHYRGKEIPRSIP
jgi:hypothetical protein